jgi:mutator protein MutT
MKAWVDHIGIGWGAIIVNDNNEVLLVQRSLDSRTEPWTRSRPWGQVEFWENIEAAIEREIYEEVWIVIKVTKLLEVTQIINKENNTHWIAFGYLAEYVSGEVVNKEPENHTAVQWFPIDKLPSNLNEYTRNAIAVLVAWKGV